MLFVVLFHFRGRNDRVHLDVMAAHGLHHDSFGFFFFELAQRVILRLECLDERVAITAKRFADDLVHPLIHDVVRDLVAFLFECLNHKASIDQIFQRHLAQFDQFFVQFLSRHLLPQQLFARRGQSAHLRVGDDVTVHNRRDAVYHLGLLGSRRAAKWP